MGFRGIDYYDTASLLSEEERLVQKTVRGFIDERVIPIIAKHYDEGTFPDHLVREMGALGLLGANLEGYGCAGLGAVAYGLILQELERGDSGLRSFVSVQGSLALYAIH